MILNNINFVNIDWVKEFKDVDLFIEHVHCKYFIEKGLAKKEDLIKFYKIATKDVNNKVFQPKVSENKPKRSGTGKR